MAKEVIFVADDFGLGEESNGAILHAHRAGALTGAALMMAQPGTADAVRQAQAHPDLQVGWHLHLNDSVPATVARWPWGASPARAGFSIGLSVRAQELVRGEITRQWELFQETGLACRFINSHHHLHTHPFVYRTLLDVVGPDFSGWIRMGQPRPFSAGPVSWFWPILEWTYLARRRRLSAWRASDTLWGVDRVFTMQAPEVRAALAGLPDGFHEFLFHPRTLSCPDTLCLLDLPSPLLLF